MQKNSLLFFCIGLILHTTQQFATEITNDQQVSHQNNYNAINTPQLSINFTQTVDLPILHHDNNLLNYFLRPISFTQQGIEYYFTHTYNHEKYTEYLPYNLSHMVQFLEYGQEKKQDIRYAQSIIKLFLQKIKGCDFINSYSLIATMPQLANALVPYVQKKEASFLQELQENLKHRFTNIFSTYYSYFQKNPDAFLDALSEQIAKKTNEVQTKQHVDVAHVKKDILRLLEITINKIVWSPKDGYDAWVAVNELADCANDFLEKNLITDIDSLDDLYWSIIHRFCYFLDIAHEDINQDTFIRIIHDIETQELMLLAIEEQENFMTSKKSFLLNKIKKYCNYIYENDNITTNKSLL